MQKNAANLLLVAMSAGLILAGCGPTPASTTAPASTQSSGSISIQENKDATASMSVTDATDAAMADANKAMTDANASVNASMDAANKAMVDANAQLNASGAAMSPEAKAAMDAANKAMMDANATTKSSMDAANKAMVDANASMSTSAGN